MPKEVLTGIPTKPSVTDTHILLTLCVFSRTVYSVNRQRNPWDLSEGVVEIYRNLQVSSHHAYQGTRMSSGGQTRSLSRQNGNRRLGTPIEVSGVLSRWPHTHSSPAAQVSPAWYPGRHGAGLLAQRLACTSREVLWGSNGVSVCEKAGPCRASQTNPHTHSALLLLRSPRAFAHCSFPLPCLTCHSRAPTAKYI